MKIKVGFKWKDITGKEYTVREITQNEIVYESKEIKRLYTNERKHFEKYIKRISKFWNDKNKTYKNKKEKLKEV